MNSRKGVILTAIVLALIAVAVPMAGMLYVAWQRAVSTEQTRLLQFSDQAIGRATLSLREATDALRTFQPLMVAPCSEAHIALMRKIALNTRTVREIGYYGSGGMLACTSWGVNHMAIHQTAADFTTPDGLEVVLNVYPLISRGNVMIEARYKNHNALIDPVRFVDIMLDSDVALALGTSDGHALGTLHEPDPALVRQALAGSSVRLIGDKLVAVRRQSGLTAVAIESRDRVLDRFRQEQFLMLPLGLLMAGFMVAVVVWFSRRRLSPRGELAIAVQRREFIVHYQPLIELKSGRCIGTEALVRWQRPDGVMVRPDLFIPLAEESGLILPITDQVIEAVVADLGVLLLEAPDLHVAVNLSPQDIKSGRVLPVIRAALAGTGIHPGQIWLEATERGFMDVAAASKTLEQARLFGHAIAIDDFGTGYSSLSYLQALPLDSLKIDKTFIDTVCTDSATSSVTPHIIAMAKTLKLKIVAEGIETRAQADYLLAREVEYGQGWLFAKALPAPEFVAFYRQNVRQCIKADPVDA